MAKRKQKTKNQWASQDAPPTPISASGEPNDHPDDPDNVDHSRNPVSPNVLPTPTTSTQPPSLDETQQPSTTDTVREQNISAPLLEQSKDEGAGGEHKQADQHVDQSQSVGDKEKTPTNISEQNGIQSDLPSEPQVIQVDEVLVVVEDIQVAEAKYENVLGEPLMNPEQECLGGSEHAAENLDEQHLEANNEAGHSETDPLSVSEVGDDSQHGPGSTPFALVEPVTVAQGVTNEDTTPATSVDEALSLDQSVGEQGLQPVGDTAAHDSSGGDHQQPEGETSPSLANVTEEAQVHSDAQESTVHESQSTRSGDQGGHGPDDVQQPEELPSLANVVASQEQEETQGHGDNEQFFDTVEQLQDDADEEKTIAGDQDIDDTEPQASDDSHEQTEGDEQFYDQGRDVEDADYKEEQKGADAWGLSASPDDTSPYVLEIIVEQPEEDLQDDCNTPKPGGEHHEAVGTMYSGIQADENEDATYVSNGQNLESTADMQQLRPGAVFDISAKEIASKDLLAIANLFSNMKTALSSMTTAFGHLGAQTEKMTSLGLDVKAAQQLQQIKSNLELQIASHKIAVESLKGTMQAKIKEAVESTIRDRLRHIIQESVRAAVEKRVRQELSTQIPEDLRKQVISHKRQILEVKASLHNSEARMYNALQTMPDLNAPLRPLLRPLPTPEQSPVVISISRSSSLGYSTLPTPATVFPQGPAPTPIRRTASNPFRLISDTVPPSPSPYFPRDMTTLFALNPEETKRLLREYGLTSATTSPTAEHPTRPRGLSIVNEDAAEEDPDIHARDLNKFMAHIGVPFLMIPAPKEKYHESAPLSSRSRRRLLTPLIIK